MIGGGHIVLLLSVSFFLSFVCPENRYYVSPFDSGCLLNTTCHNLSHYSRYRDQHFHNNAIFVFLPGTHVLESTLLVESVTNLTLEGLGEIERGFHETVMQTTVVISCENKGGFVFFNVTNLNVLGLTFTGCSCSPSSLDSQALTDFYNYLSNIKTSLLPDSKRFIASIFMLEVQNSLLSSVSVQNTTHYGLVGINMLNASIISSSFAINNIDAFQKFENCSKVKSLDCAGGNMLVTYTYSWLLNCSTQGTVFPLRIQWSNFSYGFGNYRYHHFNSLGGGISVFMNQGNGYKVDVSLINIVAFNNTGQLCGNINFITAMHTKYISFTLQNSDSSYGNQKVKSSASSGGGLQVSLGVPSELVHYECNGSNSLSTRDNSVQLLSSSFYSNLARYGGGINIWVNRTYAHIHMEACTLVQNYGWRGISLYVNQNNFAELLNYTFEDILITQSIFMGSERSSEDYRSCVSLFRMKNFMFTNLSVVDNAPNFGAYLYYSTISFAGVANVFRNNTSFGSGGGLHLSALSSINLKPSALVTFMNNRAEGRGGAISAETNQILSPLCFLDINDENARLKFINNSAKIESDAIYIGQCSRLQEDESNVETTRLFDTLDFSEQLKENPMSSAPYSVSYCANNSLVKVVENEVIAYPGEVLNLNIATLGIRNTISPGLVKIEISIENSTLETRFLYSKLTCFNIPFDVMKMPGIVTIYLKISTNQEQFTSTGFSLQKFVRAMIEIPSCPAGFQLSENVCICNRLLSEIGGNVTSNISTHLLTRHGNVWIGYDNYTDKIIVDSNCPFDYCKKETVTFSIHNPEAQCELDRSGKVCGQCGKGLSLMLGSNSCGKCSNVWLILIIPFALAGILLVVLLILLNLTVSVGTINGLIFYANVIKINEFSFFPDGTVPVVSQFISWINLDFGIPVCFYDGLNTEVKLWLQFIFPVYIFCLLVSVIIICKYSIKASKFFGHNAVPVFATLILLSYTKLFRLVVPIIQYKHITIISNVSNQIPELLWSADPSTPYNSPSHIIMVVFALLVLLLLVAPYTLLLIFQPLTLKFQYSCYQKACLNFKPLFDAYYGPFKAKSQIWPGLLLCARLVLVIVASTPTSSQTYLSFTVATVAILLTLMIAFHGVYKELYLNILESWFLLNLAVVATFVTGLNFITIISTCVILLTFFGIIAFHVNKLSPLRCSGLLKQFLGKKKLPQTSHFEDPSERYTVTRETVSSSTINSFQLMREPLIFSDDYKTETKSRL